MSSADRTFQKAVLGKKIIEAKAQYLWTDTQVSVKFRTQRVPPPVLELFKVCSVAVRF
jgi:hypothetical protein